MYITFYIVQCTVFTWKISAHKVGIDFSAGNISAFITLFAGKLLQALSFGWVALDAEKSDMKFQPTRRGYNTWERCQKCFYPPNS